MRRFLLCSFTLLSLAAFSVQTARAGTIVVPPLRKECRRAKAAFVGKVTKIESGYAPTEKERRDIPEFWLDERQKRLKAGSTDSIFTKITFEIREEWKGDVPKIAEFVAVPVSVCGCDITPSRFKADQEYLVMASGRRFAEICDARPVDDIARAKIKKLDGFWFRAGEN